ncbi:glycoside hydrolase family 13 protein [Sporolactobacillus sp. THM7-7]|nr:glycoside hydrolase family 13 protein [Sporolactobacillus sp. THM7-7]
MDQPAIYFNSWSEKFRSPFGSVPVGSVVSLAIHADQARVLRAALMIQKDGEGFQDMDMHPSNTEETLYRIDFRTGGKSGLYFYHFKIEYEGADGQKRTVYYGRAKDGYGGEGETASDPSLVQQYQLTCYGHADPAPEWYLHGVVYHIFVDRFCNGNRNGRVLGPKKNSFIYATQSDCPFYIRDPSGNIARWDFFGGNLKGIIAKLPYLHKLGVTILYLSPIFEARSNHKYDTADYRRIDPMFGDRKTFRKLIHKAGKLGMRIMLDGVFNHVGADSRYFNQSRTYGDGGACQDPSSPYYDWFSFRHYPDDYECWWGVRDLPSINHDSRTFRDFIYQSPDSVIHTWTVEGIGGWRLDVADELPDDFIAGLRKAVDRHAEGGRKVVIGEVWEDASHKIAYGKRRHYLEGGMLHGVMNYPFRSLIINLVLGRIPADEAVRASLTLKSNYPPDAFHASLNNIGTHDTTRILTALDGDIQKLRLAVRMLVTLPGVPCIYYGDEAGLAGGRDPDNRRFFPWGRENREIEAIYRSAIRDRRNDRNLQSGDYFPFSIGALFGILRCRSEEAFTVVIVNVTADTQVINLGRLKDQTGEGWIASMVGRLFQANESVGPLDYILKIKEESE